MTVKNLIGQRFGRLIVKELAPKRFKKIAWKCECDCGNLIVVLAESLKSANTSSCGCLRKEMVALLGASQAKETCKHGYPRVAGNSKDCECPVRIRQKKSANLKSNYGITLDDFNMMVAEQNNKCSGCRYVFAMDENGVFGEACLDHDHTTNKPRGILCKQCNAALGSVKENPETLRRLMAYLDSDRTKPLIYLIGRLKNNKIVQIANFFRSHGYDVFEDWNYVGPDADDWWQKREKERGRTYIESLQGRAAQNTYLFDKAYLDIARAVVLISPAGKSAFLELGYSKGNGKATYILLPNKTMKRYEVMTKFADAVVETKEEVLSALNSHFGVQKENH